MRDAYRRQHYTSLRDTRGSATLICSLRHCFIIDDVITFDEAYIERGARRAARAAH